MNHLPQVLYTKCFKHELTQRSHTLGDSGLWKKYFFESAEQLIRNCHLGEHEAIIRVGIDAFVGANPTFKKIEDGIWENNSPLLMQYISEA
jgi:hypothetical protein